MRRKPLTRPCYRGRKCCKFRSWHLPVKNAYLPAIRDPFSTSSFHAYRNIGKVKGVDKDYLINSINFIYIIYMGLQVGAARGFCPPPPSLPPVDLESILRLKRNPDSFLYHDTDTDIDSYFIYGDTEPLQKIWEPYESDVPTFFRMHDKIISIKSFQLRKIFIIIYFRTFAPEKT